MFDYENSMFMHAILKRTIMLVKWSLHRLSDEANTSNEIALLFSVSLKCMEVVQRDRFTPKQAMQKP